MKKTLSYIEFIKMGALVALISILAPIVAFVWSFVKSAKALAYLMKGAQYYDEGDLNISVTIGGEEIKLPSNSPLAVYLFFTTIMLLTGVMLYVVLL